MFRFFKRLDKFTSMQAAGFCGLPGYDDCSGVGGRQPVQLVDCPWGGDEGRAARQQLSDMTITANRGTIYDTNMNVLAQSATA